MGSMEAATSAQAEPLVASIPYWQQRTGIGRSAFYDAVRTGELRATRIGRRILLSHAEISIWLAAKAR